MCLNGNPLVRIEVEGTEHGEIWSVYKDDKLMGELSYDYNAHIGDALYDSEAAVELVLELLGYDVKIYGKISFEQEGGKDD